MLRLKKSLKSIMRYSSNHHDKPYDWRDDPSKNVMFVT